MILFIFCSQHSLHCGDMTYRYLRHSIYYTGIQDWDIFQMKNLPRVLHLTFLVLVGSAAVSIVLVHFAEPATTRTSVSATKPTAVQIIQEGGLASARSDPQRPAADDTLYLSPSEYGSTKVRLHTTPNCIKPKRLTNYTNSYCWLHASEVICAPKLILAGFRKCGTSDFHHLWSVL